MLNRKPPMTFEYEGATYHLIPWYDNVLDFFEVAEDCTAAEQIDLFCHFFVAERVEPSIGLFISAKNVLFGEEKNDGENYVDLKQDAERIYAGFRQAYGIDLHEEIGKMHWHTFKALLGNMPSNTAFAEVVNIRARKLPRLTKHNREEYLELVRLKAKYAVHQSEAQKKARLNQQWGSVFKALVARGKGSD